MKVVVTVHASEVYVGTLKTVGALFSYTTVVSGELVGSTVSAGRYGAAFAGWVTEVAALTTKGGGVVG